MTTKEAINIIEDVTWQDNGRHFGKIAEARSMAVAALREQEERSKGCDFCRADKEGYYTMAGAFSISNPNHAGKYYLNCGRVKPRRIMFCPMCGARMVNDEG